MPANLPMPYFDKVSSLLNYWQIIHCFKKKVCYWKLQFVTYSLDGYDFLL